MRVVISFVALQEIFGLWHHHQQKSVEIGTAELMQMSLLIIMLLVVIGLFPLADNFKIQDFIGDLIGMLTKDPTLVDIGVTLNVPLILLGTFALMSPVIMDSHIVMEKINLVMFAPLDVYLINLLNNHHQ